MIVWAISMVVYFRTPTVMPEWVYHWHIPKWLAKYWALGLVPAYLLFTLYAYKRGWTKLPPLPEGEEKRYPHRPDLSTRELWRLEDEQTGWNRWKW